MNNDKPLAALSPDGMTLVITQRVPGGGTRIATLRRQPGAGPFSPADVTTAIGNLPDSAMQEPGQRNTSRRRQTRFGTLWTHVMTGPPTWWLPRLRREEDGTIMAGWLRAGAGIRWDRKARKPWKLGDQ